MGAYEDMLKEFADEGKPEVKKDTTLLDSMLKDFSDTQSAAEAAAERTRKSIKRTEGSTLGNIVKAVPTGVADVGLSGLNAINEIAGTEQEKTAYREYLANRNKDIEETSGPGSEIGRVGGQVAATTPLVPIKALQAANVLLPISRSVVKNSVIGGIFGAATSAANDKGLGQNTLEGMTTGAVAGPLADVVTGGANALKNKVKLGLATQYTANAGGLGAGGTKVTLETLKKIGLTPAQAQAEIAKLGPKATLADVDPALLAEAGGLASLGDEPTSIIKNRFEARRDTSNYEATHIMNRNLGGNPDLDALKARIENDAQKAVASDYTTAKASTKFLDVKSVIDDINDKLITAVGSKKAELNKIKGYFYNEDGSLKNNAKALHEIRMQLDANINKKGIQTESYDNNTLNAAKDIRAQVDARLKSIPEMKAADEKFTEHMDILKGIDIGKNIFDRKINYAQFAKEFGAASPEKQDIIREGIKGKVYDAMDQATRGELSEAQKLFGKASANRAKFKLAFGQQADEVLDALEKEATFRASEKSILQRSHTAEAQAIQRKYGARNDGPNLVSDVAGGIVTDILHGSSGFATGVRTIRHLGGGIKNRLYDTTKTAVGAADIFSRSGAELNSALNTLDRVHSVRSRIQSQSTRPSRLSKYKLPTAPTAIGEYINQENQ